MKVLKYIQIVMLLLLLLILVTFKIFYESEDNLKKLCDLLLLIMGSLGSVLFIFLKYLGKANNKDEKSVIIYLLKKISELKILNIALILLYIILIIIFFKNLVFYRYIDFTVDEDVVLIEDRYPNKRNYISKLNAGETKSIKQKIGSKNYCLVNPNDSSIIYDCFKIEIQPFWFDDSKYIITKSIIRYETFED